MTETKGDVICNVCRRSKTAGTAGSMTQWISSCQCDMPEPVASASAASFPVCAICRMRIKEQRPGSITQWIFAENFCKCENPVVADNVIAPGFKHPGATADDAPDEEEALDVDKADFPLERYRPLKLLGRGALGEVYLCRDLLLKKKVAVKCLIHLTAEKVVSFQSEARIASKLNHPGVIGVKDFGTTSGGKPFMVMDYFPGKSLAELLADHGSLSEQDVLNIGISVCSALDYLHHNNVFHRDLKPSNILVHLDAMGRIEVRLIDFGLSKSTQDVQSKTLIDGKTIVGTPGYMSPDQINGQTYDARSEIYSLGCIMFESLAGMPPYEGESPLQLLNKHVHDDVPLLSEHAQIVSPELSDIVATCMRKRKEERYENCSQLIDILSAVKPADADQATRLVREEFAAMDVSSKSQTKPFARNIAVAAALTAVVATYCTFVINRDDSGQHASNVPISSKYLESGSKKERGVLREVTDSVAERNARAEKRRRKESVSTSKFQMDYLNAIEDTTKSTGIGIVHSGSAKDSIRALMNDRKARLKKNKKKFDVYLVDTRFVPGDGNLLVELQPTALYVSGSKGVDDNMLGELSKVKSLTSLNLNSVGGLSPKGLTHLSALPNLVTLSIDDCDLTDEHLKAIGKIPTLTWVSVRTNRHLTINGLRLLGNKSKPIMVVVNQPNLAMMSADRQRELREKHNLVMSEQKDGDKMSLARFSGLTVPSETEKIDGGSKELNETSKRFSRLFR